MSAPDELRSVPTESPEVAAARARTRRRRSIALALVLAALVIIFYALTIVKMGPAVFDRTI
ncbi:hypothetical protein PSQ90_03590 [Devosia rhodophyticola]|uniref:CoxF protein n=1 Tax=Devosia rhodophyticola TaxID=3026423 RepID=A0ABY7YZ97_9HYPH|nr:hypothetical protein [Devosia rhodophyticola]WDR06559.1 hypothetical protein PSQ90_03590 [Devosia rhodophyticola]